MLRRIDSDTLRPGFALPGALRDDKGRVLVARGAVLTPELIERLGARLVSGIYAGPDWGGVSDSDRANDRRTTRRSAGQSTGSETPRSASAPKRAAAVPTTNENHASVSLLRVGMVISHNLYDEHGDFLLRAGSKITPRFLDLLSQRRIAFVRFQPATAKPAESARKTTRMSRRQQVIRQRSLSIAELTAEAKRGLAIHKQTSEHLGRFWEDLRRKGHPSTDDFQEVLTEFSTMLALDADLLATVVSLQRSLGEYVFDHCVNTALISMSVATQLAMSNDDVLGIGLGTLLHDLGMLRVPDNVRLKPGSLSVPEWEHVRRHPDFTADDLERVRRVPPLARTVAAQLHERIDGSGYPCGHKTTAVNRCSRLAAVADCYTAMVRERPYRPPMIPHDAVHEILLLGQRGKLDRELVRALLDTVSAFPIGSLVRLNSDRIARIVRANAGEHTRPVVAIVDEDGAPTDEVIDLSQNPDHSVVETLPA